MVIGSKLSIGGSKGGERDQNSFNFMQLWEILAKSYVGPPPLDSCRPHLDPALSRVDALIWEILDPPLRPANYEHSLHFVLRQLFEPGKGEKGHNEG